MKSSDFIVKQHVLFLAIKSANFLDMAIVSVRDECFFSYLFCLLLWDVYFRSLDAEKITQASFCNLHSAVVYP